ncbi:TPA: bacteriocin secretion accessory protein [Streptococcus pneumoniae]|nr:bacteriocin secretion accessory protein [Streptococcus pneumoniae]
MNPNLFRSVEFYQRRYHNYATVFIIPLSLLFTFILIFSLVATKEITVTSQGEITPTSVIASIQSTSDNPILANHLVANQVVEKGDLLIKYSETMEESQKGDLLIKYSETMEESQKTALATQLQRLEKQKEGLGILKQSLEKATDLFSSEDEFGYHNTFMNFTKQSHDIELGISKTNTEVSNQANLTNSSSSAIEQEITKVQQQIGEYQELRDAIINNRARLPTGNPHQSILNRYLIASQGQTQGTAEEPFLSQINQSIASLESSIASLKIQQAGIGSVATYDNSLATKIEVLRTQFLQTASQQQLTVENQLTELKVQLDQATQRLENNTLTAPSKGIVHLNSEFEGKNRIPTGTEIAQIFPVITDTREVLITYYVSSDYLPLLDKGQTVRLKLEKIGNHGTTIIGQLQSIDQTPTRTEQGNLFKLTALAKLSNEDSKLIQYGLQGRVTSVTTKKTYFDYFKDKILTHSD